MSKLEPKQASPHWFYKFLDWADSSPIKIWGVGLLFSLIGGSILYLASCAVAGSLLPLGFEYFYPVIYMPILLSFWHVTNSFAFNSITSFTQSIGKTAKQTEEIYEDFVSVKGWVVWLLLLLAIPLSISYVNDFIAASQFSNPVSVILLYVFVYPTGIVQVLLMFRLFRQLLLLNFHYKSVRNINLFNLGPIYYLTGYAYSLALIAIVLVVAVNLLTLLQSDPLDLLNNTISVTSIVAFFVAPTIGISRRIRAEKAKDLRELGTQLNGLYDETTNAVKTRKLNKVPALSSAAQAVERQIEKVQKVATWPWNPGSLRNLLIPILLPLAVAILQRYVLTALGF